MLMNYDAPGVPGYSGGASVGFNGPVMNYDAPGYAGQMSGGLSDERRPLLVAEGEPNFAAAGPRPLVTQPVLMTQALPVPVMNASVASGGQATATYGPPPMSGGSAYSAPQVSGGFTAPQMQLSGGAPQVSGGFTAPQMQLSGGYAAPQMQVSGGYAAPQTQVSGGYAAPQTQVSGGYGAPQMQLSGGGAQDGRPQGGMNLLLDPNVIFATIDRNNDGQITRSEFEAAVVGAEMVVPNYGGRE